MDGQQASGRRWPVAALVLAAAVVVAVSTAGGAAHATADAASTAATLEAQGQYAESIATDSAIARRTGPLYVFDRSDVDNAELNAQRTALAWARAQAKAGNVDQAVAMAGSVHDPRLATPAKQERAALLLQAARQAASRGDYAGALSRLDQISAFGLAGVAEAPSAASQMRLQYLLAEARQLTAAGNGVAAVDALDAASKLSPAGASSAAGLFPQALLVAGKQEIAAQSYGQASSLLQRLDSTYGGTNQARQARGLLGAAQPVTGALVDRSGHALSGEVRLSSHFFSEPGGYLTSGPFFYSDADDQGDFRFDSIPVGGPYVFELFRSGNWMTFIDPNTGQPANPVTVTLLTPVDLAFITVS